MNIENATLGQVVKRLAVSESGFVFDPVSGTSITVNETGLDILRQLQQRADLAQTRHHLLQLYQVEEQEMQRDVDDFLAALAENLGLQ